MDTVIEKSELYKMSKPSLLENIMSLFYVNKSLLREVDGLRADYAQALDQCQMLKQHIQDLEFKIDHMHATMELKPESIDTEMPYSTAIMLAKKGYSRLEIVETCGLTESEADLILTLHNHSLDQGANTLNAS